MWFTENFLHQSCWSDLAWRIKFAFYKCKVVVCLTRKTGNFEYSFLFIFFYKHSYFHQRIREMQSQNTIFLNIMSTPSQTLTQLLDRSRRDLTYCYSMMELGSVHDWVFWFHHRAWLLGLLTNNIKNNIVTVWCASYDFWFKGIP